MANVSGPVLRSLYQKCLGGIFLPNIIARRYFPAVRKKFYKTVSITEMDGKYEINLDKRKLKTPLGKVFQVPNEALATAIATEWDSQQEKLQIQNMHLTSLCNTALDNPSNQTKETRVESIMEFLNMDTLCYRHNEPSDLVILQRTKWDPVLMWFQERFNVEISVCENIISIPVSEETMSVIRKHLLSYNRWALVGIQYAAENLKSLVLTLAIVNRFLDVESAVDLSRLEVEFQVAYWGKVEWSHDLELMQTTSKVAAAALFIYMSEESTRFCKKTEKAMTEQITLLSTKDSNRHKL